MDESQDRKEKPKNTPSPSTALILENSTTLAKVSIVIIGLIIAISFLGIIQAFTRGGDQESSTADFALSLKSMGNLTTVQVKVAKIGVEAEMKTGICSFGSDYLINGIIEAGIDLSNFSSSSVTYNSEKGTYAMTLPEPQLTRCEFDTNRYFDWKSICAGIDYRDLDSVARYVASTSMIQDTLDAGILNRSEQETTILIESLVTTLNGKPVEVEYIPQTSESQLPPSCNLESPSKFKQNDEGVWEKR